MRFAEEFDPTDNIKAILDAYPFSIGIFRELLQNSDDAGATKQVFLLDYRTHAQGYLKLHNPRLAETQGPALLAYNNSKFLDEDWKALRTVHSSSKRADTSKIGKYGIGFRSCYHITDYPQVISGNNLAIFDPQYHIFSDGGTKVTLDECGYHDVISAFGGVLQPSDVGSFEGTVFRFPLRVDSGSRISHKKITASEIENLLKVFAKEELDISLLFLQHISQIEIHLIDEAGNRSLYTTCNISRKSPTIDTNASDIFKLMSCDVSVGCGPETTASWLTLSGFFSPQVASDDLSERIGFDVTQALHDNKLLPNMALAIQTDSGCAYDRGRLFTFLPLPILTAFPLHVHGLFSLTQSRQNLRNIGEKHNVAKGSNDLVLLEWNDLLFNAYLPKLWSRLFQALSGYPTSSLMLQAWPKPQPDVTCGDSFIWKGLLRKVVEEVVAGDSKIWPVVNGLDRFSLKEVFLLSENSKEHLPMLPILANAGVNVSQIPQHLYDLLSDLRKEYADITLLEPFSLAEHLKSHADKLTTLSPLDKAYLLEYLLSDNRLENIVNLPIVPLPGNKYATLSRSSLSEPKRTLLSEVDFEVFESFDQNAIALHILPKNTVQLLQTQGPNQLNVQPLDNTRVVQYLGSVQVLSSDWTIRFWSWVAGSWKDRDGLLARVRASNLKIIPCVDSIVRRITDVVFQPPNNAELETAFRKLNISFASHDLPSFAMNFLVRQGCVKLLQDMHTLLENLDTSAELDSKESKTILSHFLEQSHVGLSQEHISKLYQLPIFPLLKCRGSIIDGVVGRISGEVQGIQGWTISVVTQNGLLPPEGNISFLDLSPPNDNLLRLLKSPRQPLIISELLRLSLRNFQSQPTYFQCAMVRYMTNELRSIPPDIIDQLKTIPFLPNKVGNLRAPVDLIDPHSSVAKLYPPGSEWFPSESRPDNPLVEQVAKLGLFQMSLSTRLVDERIRYITSKNDNMTAKLARTLLELMETENFDCSGIRIDLQAKWLPLPGEIGLTSPNRSRDPSMYKLGRELFDEVLDVVESIPRRLRVRISCWSSTIPFSVLSDQFERVVTLGNATKIRTIIKELSYRALTQEELKKLKHIVGDKPWIPVSKRNVAGRFNNLVPTCRAVIIASRGDTPLFGFHELPSDIPRQKFFRDMGCCERPSIPALISSLHELAEQELRVEDRLPKILVLLEALADEKLSDEDRTKILVPDLIGTLQPAHEVMYNDIPGRVLILPDLPLVHRSVHLDLATKLQIPFLGHRDLGHIQNLADSNMEETFKTKIRKALVHYSDQQLLTEMLANALDAGASKFSVLLDEYRPSRWDPTQPALLSPSMAQFYSGPSLVIHNDATFEDKDFRNVINGIGGKHDRTDTIGQFALGALTMFHVTDMPMIISGDKVLFLDSSDPDKRHLSMLGNGPATILEWRRVARTYPDHFASLEGLFGFSSQLNVYNGTLFRLPLKQELDCSHVMRLIRSFENRAERCTLFTNIESIEGFRRGDDPHLSTYFAVKADHQTDYDDGAFISKQLTITVHSATMFGLRKGSWRIVLGKDIETLPEKYHPMHKTHRIRSPLVIGLAANLAESPEVQTTQKPSEIKSLFYTLPLPEKTTLPVHLTAPFILSEDRRNIRFESNYNQLEASYNRWLLSGLVPELYYFLLEELLLRNNITAAIWWPGQSDEHENTISGMVSRSFFDKLASTTRRIFISTEPSPKHLIPKEAIISGREPSVVKKLLAKLETPNLVRFESEALLRHLCDMLREVDGVLLRREILRATSTFISWYNTRSAAKKILDLESLIHFMSPLIARQNDHVPVLEGLPLIPLLDGELGYLAAESGSLKYYYSFDPSCSRLLPAERLIHPDFRLSSELAQKGLNVLKLGPRAIRELLHERVPELEAGKCFVTEAQAKFIGIFWEIYGKLPLDTIKELASFALLPTTEGCYISIAYCQHSSVIFAAMGEKDWVLECATALGVVMIKRADINPLFYGYIPEKGTLFNALFDFFQESDLSVLRCNFMKLDLPLHSKFAKWCRERLDNHTNSTRRSYWSIATSLPIWEVYSPQTRLGGITALESVAGIPMLSSTVPSGPEIIAFMCRFMDTKFTPFSGILLQMKHSEINRENLLYHLRLPDGILNPEDVEPYETLLRYVLQGSYSGLIRVPNRNCVMTATASLFAHDDLFLAAFPDDYFCHQKFEDFESYLRKHGLKDRANLDLTLFTNCAQAFDRNLRIDPSTKMNRAQTLFQIYCEVLPLHAGPNPRWGDIDSFRFIPSTSERGQRSTWREYITERPTIASPAEVIRDDLAGIAWTQRAFLVVPPHQRILLANPSFGVPNVPEVVAHLEILADIGGKWPSNPQLLQDLTETYSWLDQHSKEAKPLLLNCHKRRLFLNVVDPSHNDWTGQWVEADRLFFNLRCDTGGICAVRPFLRQFPSLLRASGVKELQDAPAPELTPLSNETIFEKQRHRFKEMRAKQELVDVKFVTGDQPEHDGIWAHRSFLAAASDHFWLSFCNSGMEESRSASKTDPVVISMTAYSTEAVKSVLDYIYTGAPPVVARSDDMDADADVEGGALGRWFSIMNLAQLWEISTLLEIVQIRMIEEKMINPFTVHEILEGASQLNASHLVSACGQYLQDNKEALRNVPLDHK